MRYVIKKEFTGRDGWVELYRYVQITKYFCTSKEALDELEVIKMKFTGPKSKAVVFGSERDYTILRDTKYGHWITRYWVEEAPDEKSVATTTFSLNKAEDSRLHKFFIQHKKHGKSGITGEVVRVCFSPTLLGTIAHVQCLICGAVEDLTDYDTW